MNPHPKLQHDPRASNLRALSPGIDFKAPDSAVEGITKAASSLDSFFRPARGPAVTDLAWQWEPDTWKRCSSKSTSFVRSFCHLQVFTFGYKKADSLKEGPLKATFKMKGEFKLSEGAQAWALGVGSCMFPPRRARPPTPSLLLSWSVTLNSSTWPLLSPKP